MMIPKISIKVGRLAAGLAMTFSTLGAVAVVQGASAIPAGADTVSGCAQGWSQYSGTCIWVVTGGKNYSSHTQWVSSIQVQVPYHAPAGKLEAWAGNGPTGVAWYRSGVGYSFTWAVNAWIKSGSGICGAYNYTDGTPRSIACITIRV